MSSVTCQISISLDGYVAGPNQSLENPIGEGGMRLHEWLFETARWREQQGLEPGARTADSEVVEEVFQNVGAYIMGRKMFGGGDGQWNMKWTGWWGDEPPYHTPVFVLTHQAREPLAMRGGTTFNFVTEGIRRSISVEPDRARAAQSAGVGGADRSIVDHRRPAGPSPQRNARAGRRQSLVCRGAHPNAPR